MKRNLILLILAILNAGIFAQQSDKKIQLEKTPTLLIYTAVENPEYKHKVTTLASEIIVELGQKENFNVEISDTSNVFQEQNLQRYAAIIFLNTRGNVMDEKQKSAFQKYIRGGGGAAVIHVAMLTEENWEWFGKLVGAQFKDHPKAQAAKIINVAPKHKVNQGFPKNWILNDEWYNYIAVPKNVTVLLRVDESTYKGGIHGNNHPIAWRHEYDGGRVFYTAPGHTKECWTNPLFMKHILNGIKYTAGLLN